MSAVIRPARSLADELRARSDEHLRELFLLRPDLLSPLPTDMSALAARAGAAPSVARTLDGLTTWELQVLEILVVLPEPVSIEDVI